MEEEEEGLDAAAEEEEEVEVEEEVEELVEDVVEVAEAVYGSEIRMEESEVEEEGG